MPVVMGFSTMPSSDSVAHLEKPKADLTCWKYWIAVSQFWRK